MKFLKTNNKYKKMEHFRLINLKIVYELSTVVMAMTALIDQVFFCCQFSFFGQPALGASLFLFDQILPVNNHQNLKLDFHLTPSLSQIW